MNLHDRAWPTLIVGSTAVLPDELGETLTSLCTRRYDHLDEQTAQVAASRLLYYATTYVGFRVPVGLGLDDIEFKDRVPPYFARSGRELLVHYPVYIQKLIIGRYKCLAVCTPYEKVLRELTEAFRSKVLLKFAKPAGDPLAQYLEAAFGKEPDSEPKVSVAEFTNVRVDLKTAELPLQRRSEQGSTSDLRKVTLAGDSIFRSALYGRLRNGEADGSRYELSGALLTLKYRDDAAIGVSTQLSDSGRYFLRPGYCGANLNSLARLLGFFNAVKLVTFAKANPFV